MATLSASGDRRALFTNERGRTIWMSEVEPIELEIELETVFNTDPYDSGQSVST